MVQEPQKTPQDPSPRRGCAFLFFLLSLIVAAAWGGGLGVFVWILGDSDTTIQALEEFRPKIGSSVYSADGEKLGEFAVEARRLVPLNEIPLHVQKAFIATEDDTFYEHKGVRPLAVVNAVLDAFRSGRLRGASTITQQTVRNIETTGVTTEQTVERKLREMIVAVQLEREYTKDEILEIYLNQIFLGVSAYGVESASWQYFDKSVSDLTVGEAAMLAGLTRAPNTNNPFRSIENARQRRDIVLRQMHRNRFIDDQELELALAEKVEDTVLTPEQRVARREQATSGWSPNQFIAPYFVEEVRQFVSRPPAPYEVNASQDELFEGGLEIRTTIDMRLQRAAEDVLRKAMDEFDAEKREQHEKAGTLNQFVPVSAALVCLDNRPGMEGYIRAMVGGRDFNRKKFNMATQAQRQPGSSVKPFVWMAALDNGMTASSIVVDEPFEMVDYRGNVWAPKNFSGEFEGPVSLRYALEKSINIVSIKLVDQLTMPLVRSYLKSAGFKNPINDEVKLTLALGTPVTTPLDQAVCYSTLAKGGVYSPPVMVLDIRDRDGMPRFEAAEYHTTKRVFDADLVYAITHLMRGVCTPDYKRNHYPSGWRTHELNRPRAGKTGTTNDSRDAWFCGFTPQFTTVVWFGYEDNRPLGRRQTGGALCSPVWTEFMKIAHEGLPVEDFPVPAGVEFYNVDRITGLAGGEWREAFIRGAQPPLEMPIIEMPEELENLLLPLETD